MVHLAGGERANEGWIDVSVPIEAGMAHWPGDPAVAVSRERGASGALISRLALGSHAGTHVDAPVHYLPGGDSLDDLPLDALIGPARVVAIDGDAVTAAALEQVAPTGGERLLVRTRNSHVARDGQFHPDYVALTADGARLIAERRLRCLGIDGPSVAGFRDDGAAIHRILLAAGVWLIEWLDLSEAAPGPYDLVCLPLRLSGGDGAPARVALRRTR